MEITVASYMSHIPLSKTKHKNKALTSFLRLLEQMFKFHYIIADVIFFDSLVELNNKMRRNRNQLKYPKKYMKLVAEVENPTSIFLAETAPCIVTEHPKKSCTK